MDHTTTVHRWMAQQWLLAAGQDGDHRIVRDGDDDAIEFYRTGLEVLLATLDGVDPSVHAETAWAGPQDGDWLARRMAQETGCAPLGRHGRGW